MTIRIATRVLAQDTRRTIAGVVTGVMMATCLCAIPRAQAQQSASAGITAHVLLPCNVTKTQDLKFGDVLPGIPKQVALHSSDAAVFLIGGEPNANISVTVTVPNVLLSGTQQLSLQSWRGDQSETSDFIAPSSFAPGPSAVTMKLSADGRRFISAAATASPTSTQPSGNYTGTISVMVAYL